MPSPPPIRYVPGFEEPLVATGSVSAKENEDLDAALVAFHNAPLKAGSNSDFDDYAQPLLAFIKAHPSSNWNASLDLNLGLGYYHSGYYSRTFDYFNQSWELGRNATSAPAKRMADRAMGELAEMHARLGHEEELKSFFAEVSDRSVSGSSAYLMQGAHDGLEIFEHRPEVGYLCGPAALRNILVWMHAKPEQIKVADDARSGPHGYSLTQLAELADKAGLQYSLVYRKPGQPVPVPSIINWDVHHYAAILEARDGQYRMTDPTFGAEGTVLTEKAADSEGSGYFLVPQAVVASNANSGWRVVEAHSSEANAVYGMGNTNSGFPGGCNCNNPGSPPPNTGGGNPPPPMALASIRLTDAGLTLQDTPVGYTPQKGPSAKVALTYNSRDGDQPANFTFSNLGPLWSHGFQAYIQDDPNAPGNTVKRIIGGGGGYDYDIYAAQSSGYYSVYNTTTGAFVPEIYDNSQLVRIPASGPATSYVRNLPDGSKETYGLSNGATVAPRIMFLTAITDPKGDTTTLNYDSQFRLTSFTDATGRNTTFTYGLAGPIYSLLITKITDPFGRYSSMTYDSTGRLISITDPVGITSRFTYGSSTETNFITKLTTPYGASTFSDTLDPSYNSMSYLNLSLASTDPLGHVEYAHIYQEAGYPTSESVVPSGMTNDNTIIQYRNTYYWNAHEAASGGVTTDSNGNPTAEVFSDAEIYHWFHQCCTINYLSNQLGSRKRPLEQFREWYNTIPIISGAPYYSGTLNAPTYTGRVLDDGSTQLSSSTFNSFGLPLTKTDPASRQTKYTYATNNIDLQTVSQLTAPSTYTPIATYGNYNTQHEPQTYTGADGQTWHYTYNAAGQLKTVTDPLSETTTNNYDSLGRLSTVVDANNVTVLTLTYDSADRVYTRTDSQGYTLTYGYDNIDRVTSITYPDGTTDLNDYTFQGGIHAGAQSLDLRKHTDRLGRVTTYGYDANRRLTSVTEPVSGTTTRTTSYNYYEDGTLEDIVDADGNDTHWAIDLQSRPISKTYSYRSRPSETETYAYEVTNSRLHSITDAAGQVKTFSYALDNRVSGITYTSSTNATPNVSFSYDAYFPRLSSMLDGTGTTTYGYAPIGGNGGLKLSSIQGPYGANDLMGLTYDAVGRLYQRTMTGGNETLLYDPISRLSTHTTPLGSFTYGYLGETGQTTSRSVTNGTTTVATNWGYDTNANDRRLIAIANSGPTRSYTLGYTAGGVTNPYDILSITDTAASGSAFATQSHSYTYDSIDRLLSATATTPGNFAYGYDPADNATTITTPSGTVNPTYNGFNQIATYGANTYSFDANGNTLSGDGSRTYLWDAENRLIEIDYVGTSNKTVFGYNGLNERVSDAETVSGSTTTTYYRWCGSRICQSWNSSGLLKRHLDEGERNVVTGQKLVYIPDQLGSVRDVVDGTTGTLVSSTDYSPYGGTTRTSGSTFTDYQYAGLLEHNQSVLNLSATRAQDSTPGRWISRDPIKETGGLNLYVYTANNPISYTDVDGKNPVGGAIGGGEIGGTIAGPPGAVIGAVVGGIIGSIAVYEMCKTRPACPACTPPVGTIGYRTDQVPPSKPHWPFPGTHTHLYEMNQNPNNCQCFWKPIGVIDTPPPPGAVPL